MSSFTASSVLSHRQIWLVALPIILSNITVPLVGIVDTAVIGHLGSAAGIGAVALAATIFSFIFWAFGFLRMATTGFVARFAGAKAHDELAHTLLRVCGLALLLGMLIILLGRPVIGLALWLLDADATVQSLTVQYAYIRIWSAPATLLIYACNGIFIGLQQTSRVLLIQLVLNLVNISLDFLFVMGFGLGLPGVAWASLLAEYSAAMVGVLLLRRRLISAWRHRDERLLQWQPWLALLKANGDIFLRTLCLLFAFAWFTASGARQSTSILAINALLLHYLSMTAYALDGFAHAAEVLTGQAYGSGSSRRFRRAVFLSSLWACLFGLFFSAVYAIWGTGLLSFFTDIPEIIEGARGYLIWVIVLPLLAWPAYQLDGIFIGAGDTRAMRNATLFATLLYWLMSLLALHYWGNHGLWLSLIAYMLLRSLGLMFYYPRILRRFTD